MPEREIGQFLWIPHRGLEEMEKVEAMMAPALAN
jgi:hypothetical protein